MDFRIALTLTSTAAVQHQSAAMDTFVQNICKLSDLREERVQIEEKVAVVEQVLTFSAVNQSDSFTTSVELVDAMVEEASRLRNEIVRIL